MGYFEMSDTMYRRLQFTVTQYDVKQSQKKGYNIYALAQYLMAVDRARDAMADEGLDLRTALIHCFNGRLLDVCLRAAGVATSTRAEQMGRL
jgi:predicted metal-binding transcription factor (methanogenesis marker protein 9)